MTRMTRRALVIGADLGRLSGVARDVEGMVALLGAREFAVARCDGEQATLAGVRTALATLLDETEADDAVVVYAAGFGAPGAILVVADGAIAARELVRFEAELSVRTRNATVILDVGDAVLLAEDGAVVRALPRAPGDAEGGEGRYDHPDLAGHPEVVRLNACAPGQTAWETAEGGAFTRALLAALATAPDAAWSTLIAAVRAQVIAALPLQRPVLHGPVERRPFTLEPGATTTPAPVTDVATALRALDGGAASRLELALSVGAPPRTLPPHGAGVGLGDRLVVRIANRGASAFVAHTWHLDARGALSPIAALPVEAGSHQELALAPPWPADAPRTAAQRGELVVIASLDPTADSADPLALARGPGAAVATRSWVVYPDAAAVAGGGFELDDNPTGLGAAASPRAWEPAPAPGTPVARGGTAPGAVAIQLVELVVANNRALFAADIRVDALISTRSAGGETFATWTDTWRGVRDGQRLTQDRSLIYRGPVEDFLDIRLWVSRDVEGSEALGALLAKHGKSPQLAAAAGTLATAAGVAVAAAPWIAAAGGVMVMSSIAGELVRGVAGTSIGLYRTSFLAEDRFGIGRLPADGLLRAQHFAFALEIREVAG